MTDYSDMEWSGKVEGLLQQNMNLEDEFRNFKATIEEQLRKEDSYQFDQCLEASSNELKCLQEECDNLFARNVGFNEEIQALKDTQKKAYRSYRLSAVFRHVLMTHDACARPWPLPL